VEVVREKCKVELERGSRESLAPREGFEPPTLCLEGTCSGPLS
jgi:hypothetical protein